MEGSVNRARIMRLKVDAQQEGDEYVFLLAAMVRRAQLDLILPISPHNGIYPTAQDKVTAQAFLQEMIQCASRRTVE